MQQFHAGQVMQQRRAQTLGKQGNPVLVTLTLAYGYLCIGKINVGDAQFEALGNTHSCAVEQ